MGKDLLKRFEPGQVLSAARLNELVEAVKQGLSVTGPDAFVDSTGAHFRRAGRSAKGSVKVGELAETLAAGDEASMTVWTGDPLEASDESIMVKDWLLPTGEHLASGTKVMALQIENAWWIVGAWITITVLVDLRISGSSLQKKTRQVTVFWAGDTSEWSSISGGVSATVITDWQVNSPDIEVKTQTLTVLGAGDKSEWTTVHEGTTECP